MLDYLMNINLNEKINKNSLYPLLKTSSCDTNLFILSEIQRFSNTSDFFKHYTNKQSIVYIKILNDIKTKLSSIYEEKANSTSVSAFEEYMKVMSKIILATHLICKIQEILADFAQKTKKYYSKKIRKDFQSNFGNFLNNLDNNLSNQLNDLKNEELKESYTRCPTKANTDTSCKSQLLSKDTLQNVEINSNLECLLSEKNPIFKKNSIENEKSLMDINTPKFENNVNTVYTYENENDEDGAFFFYDKKSKTLKIESAFDSEESEIPQNSNCCRFESSLSLANLKFTNSSSSKKKVQKIRASVKKNNTVNVTTNKSEIKNDEVTFKIENLTTRKSVQDQNIRSQIIRDLLETVGILYKKNVINSEQKVELKKKIISDLNKLINSFYEMYAKKNFSRVNLIDTLKNIINK